MTLGQRIYQLRTQKNLSQGDLADMLEVSRQSISKWETDSSVPELDKLVKLSSIFEITLDELILEKQPEPEATPEPQVIYVERQSPHAPQRITGTILLCFSALVWLMISLLGDVLSGLVLASPFAVCGLICLFTRKHAVLWCLWTLYGFVELYLRFATGVSWGFVFLPHVYTGSWTVQLIVAWVILLCFGALTLATLWRFRRSPPGSLKRNIIIAAVFWAAHWLSGAALRAYFQEVITDPDRILPYRIVSSVSDWIRTGLLILALVFTVRAILCLFQEKKAT